MTSVFSLARSSTAGNCLAPHGCVERGRNWWCCRSTSNRRCHGLAVGGGTRDRPPGNRGIRHGMFGSRLVRRFGLRRLLIASNLLCGVGFLLLTDLPSSGHFSAVFAAVILVCFGTVGAVMGTTIMAAQGMAEEESGTRRRCYQHHSPSWRRPRRRGAHRSRRGAPRRVRCLERPR